LVRDSQLRLSGPRDETKLGALSLFESWIEGGAGGLLAEDESARLHAFLRSYRETSPLPVEVPLPGPVGEDNRLRFVPRGAVLGDAVTIFDALHQFGAALSTGNRLLLHDGESITRLRPAIPKPLQMHIAFIGDITAHAFDAVLVSDKERIGEIAQMLAGRQEPIKQAILGNPDYSLFRLVKERTVSVNTAAAGGNASLMSLGN
jgi:RHH-type proline utilization regulon transcriptional repressor/proline dehydrogenase/delta 1-pyrroline-5-carboxylate dehydrogenase